METRKITVINSRTQSQSVIENSSAKTLGELKSELDERGIDYSGMSFFEGHLRAELKDDESPFPETIPYRGQEVRDLVFMLTSSQKNIKSGAMSRKEIYEEIKRRGLQEECKDMFGKNFTQCSTGDLLMLVTDSSKDKVKQDENPAPENVPTVTPAPVNTQAVVNCGCRKAVERLLDILYDNDCIEGYDRDAVMEAFEDSLNERKSPDRMSRSDIDDMFNFL